MVDRVVKGKRYRVVASTDGSNNQEPFIWFIGATGIAKHNSDIGSELTYDDPGLLQLDKCGVRGNNTSWYKRELEEVDE